MLKSVKIECIEKLNSNKKRLKTQKTVYNRGETSGVYYVKAKKWIIGYGAIQLIYLLFLKKRK